MSASPKELEVLWPLNTYENGDTIPYLVGECRNLKPYDIGQFDGAITGYYQYHDGATPLTINAYDNGTALSYDGVNPNLGSAPSGDYRADQTLGTIRSEGLSEVFTMSAQGSNLGGTYSANSIDIITYIVGLATNDAVAVNTTILGDDICWYFTKQKPLREWLEIILTSIDCYYIENETDDSITIRRRYNGLYADRDGVPNVVDAFAFSSPREIVKGSVINKGTRYRPQKSVFHYDKNYSPLTGDGINIATKAAMEKEYESVERTSPTATDSPRAVFTAFKLLADVDAMATSANQRDGTVNENYTLSLVGVGYDIKKGDVGTLTSPEIPSGNLRN